MTSRFIISSVIMFLVFVAKNGFFFLTVPVLFGITNNKKIFAIDVLNSKY